MSKAEELNYLIVCSDDRAVELSKVLRLAGTVYLRSTDDRRVWSFTLFDQNISDWVSVEDSKVPSRFDALFFHTGGNDPKGIPTDRTFLKEFAFSGGNLPSMGQYGERTAAIAMRGFPEDNCPVKKRHLPELKEFILGVRTAPPAFCRRDETIPTLWSLAILIQGYAAAGIAYGDITPDGSFATVLKWSQLKSDQSSRLSNRLADYWGEMQRMDWWRISLGISDDSGASASDAKSRLFLARLIQDLELDVEARRALGLSADTNLSEQSVNKLLGFLGGRPNVSSIVELLRAERAEPRTVESAYKQVKDFLELK
jgi:hypothetical protein